MGLHDGHRQRVKEEFLACGLASFSDLRALELLLFYARPQGDVAPTAQALLQTFGSLDAVLSASQTDLAKVPGIGQHALVLLRLVADMTRQYLAPPVDLQDPRFLISLFSPCFRGAVTEHCAVACFDDQHRLLSLRSLGEGSLSSAQIQTRQIASAALGCNSHLVILAHNHPSNVLLPSSEDITTTRYLSQYLAGLEIHLLDHVILGQDDLFSLRKNGILTAGS
jgi:DNA repair protein RadC